MLKALHTYAQRKELTPPAGYVNKTVSAYICLLADGRLVGIELGDKKEGILSPDIGTLANGKDKCNVFLEKRSIVFPMEPSAKSRFFRITLVEASEAEPLLKACILALEDEELVGRINAELDANKIKQSDRVTFKVNNQSILSMEPTISWWQGYRRQLQADAAPAETALCLIAGEPTVPLKTTPKIKGLQAVGGHANGDALISFDKAAFRSYGLEQSANAPVSVEAFSYVKAALDNLLEGAPILTGVKFVHWYDHDIPQDEDAIAEVIAGGFDTSDDDEEEENVHEKNQKEIAARKQADELIKSVRTGAQTPPLDTSYYILQLSGVNGRVMIRHYEQGNYAQLQQRIERWNDELCITNPGGTGHIKPCKLFARMIRLLSYQKSNSRIFERLGKELSGLTPVVLNAILNYAPLPDTVAARAIAYVRSDLLSKGEDSKASKYAQVLPDGTAIQWLKVWLMRRNKDRRNEYMEEYNFDHSSPEFHCGGMMAVYAAIQKRAMPDVNVGVAERYFASALQTPALVIGRLAQMSVHHLSKLKPGTANYYSQLLQQLAVAAGDTVPSTLDLEHQSTFALGYYQMGAYLEKNRKAAQASMKQTEPDTDVNRGDEDGN